MAVPLHPIYQGLSHVEWARRVGSALLFITANCHLGYRQYDSILEPWVTISPLLEVLG